MIHWSKTEHLQNIRLFNQGVSPFFRYPKFVNSVELKVFQTLYLRQVLPTLQSIRQRRSEYFVEGSRKFFSYLEDRSDSQIIHWYFKRAGMPLYKFLGRIQKEPIISELKGVDFHSLGKENRIYLGSLESALKNCYRSIILFSPVVQKKPFFLKIKDNFFSEDYESILVAPGELIAINRKKFHFESEQNPLVLKL